MANLALKKLPDPMMDLGQAPMIHLDANANAPVIASVKVAVADALESGANPSSAHAAGDAARAMLTSWRDAVCELCAGVFPEDVVFTSGCTEANNGVIAAAKAAGASLIVSAVEHASVFRPAQAFEEAGGRLIVIPVSREGLIDLAVLMHAVQETPGPLFVSIQAANSETGVLQPLDAIAAICANRQDVLFHADAAQAFGKIRIVVDGVQGPDVISISGHKLHGPMGVGALLLRSGEQRLAPWLLGGDQERGLRAGTQALPLIAGLAAACRSRASAFAADIAQMVRLRDRFETQIRSTLPSIRVNGATTSRLPNTSNLMFPGIDAMAMLALLDDAGILASQGSACHSRRPEPSPVLMAMGLSEDEAFASMRFSMSPLNTEAEIDAAVASVSQICQRLGLQS